MAEKEILKFPKDFLWGAATSSHQVEGGNVNDWSEWEKENAERLAKEARTYWQKWQQDKFSEMFEPKNYISGKACDHYNRFREDFDIAKQLGHNAHRFSIEWSRIESEEGKFNEEAIEHYRQVIGALRERNIEPMVTLWHWPIPLWLRDKSGFKNRKIKFYFSRYAEKIVSEFKQEVKFWITLNEPEIYSANSYLMGKWPPQEKNLLSYLKVLMNLIWIHRRVYRIIKKINPQAQVGIAKNNIYFEAYKNRPWNFCLKKCADFWWNFLFLNKTWLYLDFIGLNYYYHNRIKNLKFNQNENQEVSDMGWEIYPEGIYYVLKDLKRYKKPVYITENGLADAQDEKREKFIKEHLYWIWRAIQEGADVRGYAYWSLLDNFEWAHGFTPRFGLIEVDYKTLERKIRPSAYEYVKICKTNELII
ncbi:MAG: glycoside hydrolase family 1 protein [Patescibacteria group bacterium]